MIAAPLRAVLVTPLSGPLARFGQAGAAALRLWAERAADLGAPWTSVDLRVVDAYPSAGTAMRATASQDPDVLFGPYGSGPAVAAMKSTQRVVWNHGGATIRLRRPTFAHALNVLTPAANYFDGVLRLLRSSDPAIERVSLLHSTSGFGQEIATGAAETARQLGMAFESTPFAAGQSSAAVDRLPEADALLVAGNFEDELAAARLLLGRGWRAAGFVSAGVEEVLAPLGQAREGLLGPAQWMANLADEPDEGPNAAWFAEAFQAAVGANPPYPAAAAFASGVLVARCIRNAGSTEDDAVLGNASRLKVRTLFGDFRLDPETGLQIGHELLVVQWQSGVRRVVWPPHRAERPIVRLLRS